MRIDADALDPSLPAPQSGNGLLTALRVSDTTIQMDLGPRFSAFRATPPVSQGAAAAITVELTAAPAETSAAPAAPTMAPDSQSAPAGTPVAPEALPVFGVATRPTVRTVMLDPGHGGDDTGVKGAAGTLEKDLTLLLARKVKAAIETRLGMRVLLTREDDRRLGADARAAIANNNKADVFIALHANGSPRPGTRGAEVFTLSLDRFGEEARRQSQAREVVPLFGGRSREISLVDWELAQAAHLDGSNALAGIVDQKLRIAPRIQSVTLQRSPMRPLAGTNMPAVLIEIGYLSNADEEQLMTSGEFQNAIALALTESIAAFRDHLEQASAVAPTP